jgi:hypothetical protein
MQQQPGHNRQRRQLEGLQLIVNPYGIAKRAEQKKTSKRRAQQAWANMAKVKNSPRIDR